MCPQNQNETGKWWTQFDEKWQGKGKVIPETGRGSPQGCETSRLPHSLDNWLIDGGETVSLKLLPPFNPRMIPGTHFCSRLSRPQGRGAAGRIRSIEKCNDLIGNRTRDLPVCSTVLQLTTLPRAPCINRYFGYEASMNCVGLILSVRWQMMNAPE
jgi:hypothetical protein